MNKKNEGIDCLLEEIKKVLEEKGAKNDMLLHKRGRFDFYLSEATAELNEDNKNILVTNDQISLIERQLNSLLEVRRAFSKEPVKDSDAVTLIQNEETRNFSSSFEQSNFDWIYSEGMELFINENKERLESYKNTLCTLKNRRDFLEKRKRKCYDLISDIDNAIFWNKVALFLEMFKASIRVIGNFNKQEAPGNRPKVKIK